MNKNKRQLERTNETAFSVQFNSVQKKLWNCVVFMQLNIIILVTISVYIAHSLLIVAYLLQPRCRPTSSTFSLFFLGSFFFFLIQYIFSSFLTKVNTKGYQIDTTAAIINYPKGNHYHVRIPTSAAVAEAEQSRSSSS